jgi:hypothetical protein
MPTAATGDDLFSRKSRNTVVSREIRKIMGMPAGKTNLPG